MSNADEETVEELKEAFAEFDKNKDGRVNGKELSALMRYMGNIMTDGEVMDMIRGCGGTMDITEQQFIAYMSRKSDNNADEEELVKAFQVFDKDASGTISIAELRYVLCVLGEKLDDEIVESMLNQADPSGSGAVRYEPFVRQMMSQPL